MNHASTPSRTAAPRADRRAGAPLKWPLPAGRSFEQVWNHYLVERALAAQLKAADRDGRSRIFATMYGQLFAAVPDHPRLTQQSDEERVARANRAQYNLLRRWIGSDSVLVEFAAGDCEFAAAMAGRVRKVVAVDIADQRAPQRRWPGNFELVVYDGYALPQIAPGSVDVVFSHQFIEHLHPDDAAAHLALARSLLKPGGCYVIHTPHAASGPWDVSRHFCDAAEGFHLKEWTYGELRRQLHALGYSRVEAVVARRGFNVTLPFACFTGLEALLGGIGRQRARRIANRTLRDVMCVAYR